MTQIALHGLDVVTALKRYQCIAVTQIVEAFLIQSQFPYNVFEMLIYGHMTQISAPLVRENEIPRIVPSRSRLLLKLLLAGFLRFQEFHDRRRDHDISAHAVLGGHQRVDPADLLRLLQLLLHMDRAGIEVHAVPCEPQHLALPHTGEECDQVQEFKLMPSDRIQKPHDLFLFQRFDFLFRDLRKFTELRRIEAEHSQLDRLLQRPVQHTMDVFDGLCRKALFHQQGVIKLLDAQGFQLIQRDPAQRRFDVPLADSGVGVHRVRLDGMRDVGFQPDVQPV